MREFHNDDTGWNCQESTTLNPTWEQVEAAIRKLDKFQNPFAWFYLSPNAASGEVPEFEVVGGEGDYAVACSIKGFHQRMPCNPDLGNKMIAVWTSDQGAEIEAKNIIYDVDLVLELTRYFCEHADFSPAVSWDPDKRKMQ